MERSSVEKGRRAEEIAAQYLIDKGLQLLERNWRGARGEIDLIMMSQEGGSAKRVLHIVEVRSLHYPIAQTPLESVNYKKQLGLIRAANLYIKYRKIESETQFDIVSITFKEGRLFELDYIPNAFNPQW